MERIPASERTREKLKGVIEGVRQPFLDFPHQVLALLFVGFGRLLVDQLVDFRAAIARVVAFRRTDIVLIELLVRVMSLTLDRKAFIDIITEGQGDIGGTMLPEPEGIWSMPPELLRTLPGYDPDVTKNRAEARQIMQKLGLAPLTLIRAAPEAEQ